MNLEGSAMKFKDTYDIVYPPPPHTHTSFSTYDKHEMVLRLLLEYAEMDLNAVLRSHTTANRMATVLYFWNQMLEIVKVYDNRQVTS